MQHLGMKIRSYRKKMGLTQTDVAEKIGCSLVTMSAIESGKNVGTFLIAKTCEVLGLQIEVNPIKTETETEE